MDSNLSRLYYMLGNYDNNSSSSSCKETATAEVDNLIHSTGKRVEFPRSCVDGTGTSTGVLTDIEPATIEITSNTTILNSDTGVVQFQARVKPLPPPMMANGDVQAEFHFNPLYTISDGGLEAPPPSPPATRSSAIGQTQQMLCPPTDHYGLIYFALLLAGIGFLLPYNSFVIAADYFQQRFPSTTIVFDMSTTYILVALFTVIISNVIVESIPLFWRLNLGYLLSFVIMIFVVIYEIWANLGGYWANLLMIAIAAVGCTIQQSTFYGYTSMLPKK